MPISTKIRGFIENASWIRRMFEKAIELKVQHGADSVLDFTLGNPTLEPPQAFVDRLRDLAANPPPGLHRYMPNAGFPAVREAVAEALGRQTGVALRGEHVLMTVGAAGALNVALKALLDPGDEVIVLAPYFVEYLFYIDNHGGTARVVETDHAFLPDVEAIGRAIGPQTKAIILNSPNNPTGVVYPRALLERLAAGLGAAAGRVGHPIYVLSDEPYRKIRYVDEVTSALSVFQDCVMCTSHSKDLSLPGERIGLAAVHPEAHDGHELLGAMTFAIRTLGFVNAPAILQLAVAGLQDLAIDVEPYRRRRDLLYRGLVDAGYECVLPGGAFYLFPRSPIPDDVEFVRRLLRELVLVVPGSGFGRGGHFRLSYCVDLEVIERALPALRRAREGL
ncbi:MAG: pyridoxal phosphate-dependent aminotransferase [Deltaproteobacteria bacterium]|nr:pyridoxal phosphate-dependent aminotransferase [Deltaproteobacteria bacterium]